MGSDINELILLGYKNEYIKHIIYNGSECIKLPEYRDRVGCVNGYTLHIYVKESDSEIPHFHIKHKGDSPDADITIKLETNEFYIHGIHTKTLDSIVMKRIYKYIKSDNIWTNMVKKWNTLHPNNKISDNVVMPDYRKMKSLKK